MMSELVRVFATVGADIGVSRRLFVSSRGRSAEA
jgi:hypothetical protein